MKARSRLDRLPPWSAPPSMPAYGEETGIPARSKRRHDHGRNGRRIGCDGRPDLRRDTFLCRTCIARAADCGTNRAHDQPALCTRTGQPQRPANHRLSQPRWPALRGHRAVGRWLDRRLCRAGCRYPSNPRGALACKLGACQPKYRQLTGAPFGRIPRDGLRKRQQYRHPALRSKASRTGFAGLCLKLRPHSRRPSYGRSSRDLPQRRMSPAIKPHGTSSVSQSP